MKKIIFLIVLLHLGCENEVYDFPQVDVNLNLYINNPEFFNIEAPGGWIYLNGGVAGILLYRKNLDEFIAYDRASTYNPVVDCGITVDLDNIILEDPCSDSQFLITDGSVIQGPASQALKRYNTNLYGNNLSIYN
jgi:nitrite reductase/ring-hydroxylating ferredoxin subunit